MCGISGILTRTGQHDLSSLIRRINDAMSHRGPDADGFFVDEGIALGHRRLSIIDLSSAANQPFEDASGRYVMVFNGEVYNFMEVRRQLPDYPFRTSGDTEVVLAAYAKWGADCLSLLKGMFSLVIWDRVERSLFMARDRFGVKPLYYYKEGGCLIFASEVRAILASGLVPRKANRAAVVDYLKYQSFVSPFTLIENIFQVPAGHYMTYKDGVTEQKAYWDITKTKQEIGTNDLSQIHSRIKDLLFQSVERRLVSDVPLGAFLSGGIDSSAVVAIMSRVDRTAINAFTIAFEEKEYNEYPFAEMVAKKFGVSLAKVLLKPADFLDSLPEALDAMDSPSGDGLNTYVVSKAIKRNGITVALSGIGGDELFAGYPFFKHYFDLRKRKRLFDRSSGLRRALAALMPSSDQRTGRLKGLLRSSSSAISDIYPAFRQIQDPFTLRRLMKDRAIAGKEGNTLENQLRDLQQGIDGFDPLSQVSIAEYLGYTQSVLLKDADQMGMAVSLEIREPFFDNDLVEYVLSVPDKFKYPAYPKKLLVESLGGMLPDEIVFRKKQGFVLPYNVWMRNDLKDFCGEKIRTLAARGYFSEQELLGYWNKFIHNKANIRPADIWIFVVLEHWLEKNEVV